MVRRIVTANNAEGKSYIAADETVTEMYVWNAVVGDPLGLSPDGAPTRLLPSTAPHIEPPAGGSKCARVEIQPWTVMKPIVEAGIPGLDARGFHRTATVDYIMVIAGEVKLLLDEGDVIVRAGDLVVQRNTNHAWHNLGDTPADFWGVMVSMLPAP